MLPNPASRIKKPKKRKRRAAEDTLAVKNRQLLTPAPVTSPPLPPAAAPAAPASSSSSSLVLVPPAPPSAKVPPAPAATCLEFHTEIVAWLAKRKLELPSATSGLAAQHDSIAAYAAALCEALGGPQPELRERERRALVRFATQRAAAAAAPPPSERHSSSSEDEDGLAEAAVGMGGLPAVEGGVWPAGLEFSSEYRWGPSVPEELLLRCRGFPQPPDPPTLGPSLRWPPPTPTHPPSCGLPSPWSAGTPVPGYCRALRARRAARAPD